MVKILKVLLSLLVLQSLSAVGADSLSYSGRLVNPNGSPVTGPVNLKFDLAYTNDLTVIKCTQQINNIDLINGVFHAKLNLNCSPSTLTEVLENIPLNNSIAIRVTDLTPSTPKIYSYQALHSLPFSIMSEMSKQLVQMGASAGQILTWNGTQWAPADPVGTMGGVTTIVGSGGLNAVRVDETVTLGIADGGVTAVKLDQMGAASGQVLKWNGTAWAPAADVDTGLTTEVDPTVRAFARNDVTGIAPEICNNNQVLRYISVDNSLRCFDLVDDAIVNGETSKAPSQNAVFDALALKQNTIDNSSELMMKSVRVTNDGLTWVGVKAPNAAGNLYFTLPAGAGVDGQVLKTDGAGNLSWVTHSTNSAGIVDGSIVDADIAAGANIAQSKISGLTTSLTNLQNSITSLTTDDVAEGSRLYFTEAKVLGTDLAGLDNTNGAITSADTVLSSIGKLIGNLAVVSTAQSNYVLKSGDTMSGNLQMGGFAVTGLATPTIDSDAATKKYVDDTKSMTKLNSYAVPSGSSSIITLPTGGTSLNNGWAYKFHLAVQATATPTGASYIVYQTGVGVWAAKLVSANGNTSNHPLLQISGTNVQVYHNHGSTYTIGVISEAFQTNNTTILSPQFFGLEGAMTNLAGNIGIGTTTPRSKLEVAGGIQIGSDGATCDSTKPGTLRYNSGNVEYCNGSSWQAFGVSGAGITSLNGSNSATQSFAVGSSGTSPTWLTAGGVHTINIPQASASSVTAGLLSKADYDVFNAKLGTASTFAGDMSGTYNSTSVDKLKGTTLAISSLSSGNFLKFNGTNWINAMLSASDIPNLDAAKITTGVLPVSRGGTNTSSLSGNRILVSTATAIIEAPALIDGQLLIGSTSGAPVAANLSAGTGVTITNSPGGISISALGSGGTVTNVSGNAPISVATGTTTPVISITQANGTTNGYLSSTDWTTFNNKQNSLASGATINGIVYPASGVQTLQIPLAPINLTDATNKQYVDNKIATADNQWILSAGNVHRATGNVGIGTSSASNKLEVSKDNPMPNTINGDIDNFINAASLKISTSMTSGGNALYLGTTDTYNGRTGWIQAGHKDPNYSTSTSDSEILLQPLGGQVGIGTSVPVTSAILDVTSSTKGMLPPRMTAAQRDAIVSPASGLMIYNTTANQLQVYDGVSWTSGSGSGTQEVSQGANVNMAQGVVTDILSLTVASGGKYLVMASGNTGTSQPWAYFSVSCNLRKNGTVIDTKSFYYGATNGGSGPGFPMFNYSLQSLDTGDILKITCLSTSDAATRFTSGWKISLLNLGINNQTGSAADNMGDHIASQTLSLANNWLSGDGDSEGIKIDSNGNVGIGVASPTTKLEVSGTVKATNFQGTLNGIKMAAGEFIFADGTCGDTVGAPCSINISGGGFSGVPACTITMRNRDATSYTEKMVVKDITASALTIWRGNYQDAGTTMQGYWTCMGN